MAENEWVTGNVRLNIKGYPLEMEMTVPAMPVKPHRMLPVLQQMASSLVEASAQTVESQGKTISCKAGCGACCRQPVPISEVEVYQIAELVESMPEPRRSVIKQRFADGVAHFKKVGWFDKINGQYEDGKKKESVTAVREAIDVVMEYFYEGIPCPFLENESCSIHPNRPIACREYLVTSPAENCAKPTAQTVRVVDLILKPSRTVRELGRTGQMKDYGLLTLIRALELAELVPENFEEKTGEAWMADFFRSLTKQEVPEIQPEPVSVKRAKKRMKRRGKRPAVAQR
jgi:Fe-S-cluster containining protein